MWNCFHIRRETTTQQLEAAAAADLEPLSRLAAPLVGLALALCFLIGAAPQAARSSGLDPDERVVLHSTAAALDASGKHWRVPVHVCVFEPERADPLRAAALEPLRRLLAFEAGTAEAGRFSARARLFLVDHERDEHVNVSIGDATFRVGPTLPNGHCESVVEVPVELAEALGGRLPLEIGAAGDPTGARGVAWLVPPEGLSVVSDLDDTIKITEIGNRRAALANTLLHEFRAVPGMAELFQRLTASRLAQGGAAFHYVSLSPWQLAPLLEEFLAGSDFPPGSLHLQLFRIQDGDFADLVGDSHAKKLAAIEPLFSTWPKRRFVLIGDSGQQDPEVYGELARRHPQQVELLLIRDVAREPREEAGRQARYAAAFAEVPAKKWQLFATPAAVVLPAK